MGIISKSQLLAPRPATLTDDEISECINKALSTAIEEKRAVAYANVGINIMIYGRDGGLLFERAVALLGAAGYTGIEMDGRTGHVMIPLRP